MELEIIVFFSALGIALLSGPVYIPFLRYLKFGQTVRDNGPQSHLKKQGTPTIGGLIFMTPITVVCIYLYVVKDMKEILSLLIVTLGFGLVGFLDDILKIIKKSKDGLAGYQKMILLLLVSVGFIYYILNYTDTNTIISIDFFGFEADWDMGWIYWPFSVFVLLAMTNAVNLSDGLDGLCASTSMSLFAFFALTSMFVFKAEDITLFSLGMTGALLGFLFFNMNPAKVFMGDTGSLALGGALGAVAILLGRPLLLLVIGLLYVIEALSVILQVGYFKMTHGKRLFRMAPIHHHFELCGWNEKKVTGTFFVFTVGMCILAYFGIR